MSSRSTIFVCILLVVFVLAQLFAYNKLNVIRNFKALSTIQLSDEEALLELSVLCNKLGIKLYLLDTNSLEFIHQHGPQHPKQLLKDNQFDNFLSFGIDGKHLHLFQAQVNLKT